MRQVPTGIDDSNERLNVGLPYSCPLPSLSGFFKHFKSRIKIASCGIQLRDKFILFASSAIGSFPATIRRQHLVLDTKVWTLSHYLIRRTIVDVNGVKYVLVDPSSVIAVSSAYQPWMSSYLKPAPGDVFIDVGANCGKYALPIAKAVGRDGLVVAVEPNRENYQALLKGVELNGLNNLVALNFAAWNRNCKIKMFVSHRSGWHSVKQSQWGAGCVEVETRKLDSIVEELNITRVDWVKIDVERAEIEVLEGFRQGLNKWHPKLIVEVVHENRKAFLSFMKKLGYKAVFIEDSNDFYCKYIDPDGGDGLSDLRPLQWENNVATSDKGQLTCVVAAEGTKNVKR